MFAALFLITLTGVARFTLVEEKGMQRGYRRARGNFRPFAADLAPPQLEDFDRPGLIEALRRYFAQRGFDANWQAIDAMSDTALVTSLSMVCPFDPMEKQALLEALTLSERAQALRTLLRIDSHETLDNSDPDSAPRRLPS